MGGFTPMPGRGGFGQDPGWLQQLIAQEQQRQRQPMPGAPGPGMPTGGFVPNPMPQPPGGPSSRTFDPGQSSFPGQPPPWLNPGRFGAPGGNAGLQTPPRPGQSALDPNLRGTTPANAGPGASAPPMMPRPPTPPPTNPAVSNPAFNQMQNSGTLNQRAPGPGPLPGPDPAAGMRKFPPAPGFNGANQLGQAQPPRPKPPMPQMSNPDQLPTGPRTGAF
jgi:hypothetical protein